MPKSSDLFAEAGKLRSLANRARRMAAGLTQRSDRDRLHHYADGLEQQAAELDQTGQTPPRRVTQDQQQVQQQQQAEPQAKEKD